MNTKAGGAAAAPAISKKRVPGVLATVMLLCALTCGAMLVQGFHSGMEDDAIYLPAIKKLVNPALYPYDAQYFSSQTKGFPVLRLVAASVRVSHLPVEMVQLLWQIASVFLLIAGCWQVSKRCFSEFRDRLGGVALVASLLTMPVAGTALYISDQHLHPRTLSCAALLFAISAVLDRRYKLATLLSVAAVALHPLMGGFGMIYVVILGLPLERLRGFNFALLGGLPLPIILNRNAAWQEANARVSYLHLSHWAWYEWLGAFAPMALLWWFSRVAEKIGSPELARLCKRLVLFSVLMTAAAMVVGIPASLDWIAPIQPMRHLQLVYLLMLLAGGGLLAHYVLKSALWRWALLFVPLCGGMLYAQRDLFPTSPHIDLRGERTENRWVLAFRWIRDNTPQNAYFAVDPNYMRRPGEEYFGFRAIAERSKLADYSKDMSVVAVAPDLAPAWKEEVESMRGYENFQRGDFLRLKGKYGVDWALTEKEIAGLDCPYHQKRVFVCRIE